MTLVHASITISLDGYVVGPDDGPGKGLGEGGERLHYWVFGGPWSYDSPPEGEATGADAAWLSSALERLGAVVAGRWTYEAAGHWGNGDPWGVPVFIVTHRLDDQPEGGVFTFVDGVEQAVARAREEAGDKDVSVMGGADVIRQALVSGIVDKLSIVVVPITLGGGKRLFDGFTEQLELEHEGVRQSPFATFIDYRIKK
ncbi:MAG: dihydrofolate reductase family protein [Actinobacteria bacterium]|nr:dihydrofolate reductase family protein [Actinomycetota bacterium]